MPYLTIDCEKIVHNTRTIIGLCAQHGIEVTGVTKAACGMALVAEAMCRGGMQTIGDSRLRNIERIRSDGLETDFMLLRSPTLSQVEAVVAAANISLNSEVSIIRALAHAAKRRAVVHDIILMVDLGDLREGIWPDDLVTAVREVERIDGVRLVGLGTTLGCYGGVVPTIANMTRLASCAQEVETVLRRRLRYVSGGNSGSLPLMLEGGMPKKINHLRIGEAILLGRDTVNFAPIPGCLQGSFKLHAEIIELKAKPSQPIGRIGRDAFGRRPVFPDQGRMLRVILDMGRADIDVEGIVPETPRLKVVGASSDHLIVDVTHAPSRLQPGDTLAFDLNYAGLLRCMLSEYVEKRPQNMVARQMSMVES